MKLKLTIVSLAISMIGRTQTSWWFWSQLKAAVTVNCNLYVRNNIIASATANAAPLPPMWNGWKVPSGACCAYSQNLSDSVSRCPPRSMRFELNKADSFMLVGGSVRTEVNRPTTAGAVVNVKRWYGWSVYLQAADWTFDPAPEVVGQWHSNATAPDGTSPFLALWSMGGHWWIAFQGIPQIDLGAYVLSAWTDWVFEVQWDNTNPVAPAVNTGYLHVWKNGAQVVNLNNIKMGYSTQTFESYMKFGIYKWSWKAGNEAWGSTTRKRICYYDEVYIGNQNATYNDVSAH